MNLSEEKRKMPRMQVDLSAWLFWGLTNSRSNVNIRNLSIHGISFRSKKYFTQGTQFHLILPNEREKLERTKIQAEVVRCETVNGFSSGGRFKVGARFLFNAHESGKTNENPTDETSFPLQPIDSRKPVSHINGGELENYPDQITTRGTQGPSARGISISEVYAEHLQSVRSSKKEETVITSIQIRLARFISSSSVLSSFGESTAEIGTNAPFSNLARQNFSEKGLP